MQQRAPVMWTMPATLMVNESDDEVCSRE